MYDADEAHHQLSRRSVVQALTPRERTPGVELERVADRRSQQGSLEPSDLTERR
jgi:hypothetical protein